MSDQLEVFDPDALTEDEQEALALIVRAESLVVDSQESFAYAATVRRLAKDMIAAIQGEYKPLKVASDKAKRAILDQEQAKLETPMTVLSIVNKKLADYETAQRRERTIAEARAAQEGVGVPAVAVPVPKVEGLGFTSYWRVEVTDRMAFIKAVAGGWGSPMALEPNLSMLNDLARLHKGQLEIPGAEIHEERRPRG
jgi:hypothetical protein